MTIRRLMLHGVREKGALKCLYDLRELRLGVVMFFLVQMGLSMDILMLV